MAMTDIETIAAEFVDTAALPAPPPEHEFAPSDGAEFIEPPRFSDGDAQNVVVGSQLTMMTPDISAQLKSAAANTFLFAQLYADRALADAPVEDPMAASLAWYKKYWKALTRLGWGLVEQGRGERTLDRNAAAVHRELVPVLVGAFTGATAAVTVVAALRGLAQMEKDQPWITFYDRKSERARAHQFQMSQLAPSGDTQLELRLMQMMLDAGITVRQFLFFKQSDVIGTFSYNHVRLQADNRPLLSARVNLEMRLAPFQKDFIAAAPLPDPV